MAPVSIWVHGGGFSGEDSGTASGKKYAYYAKDGIIQVMAHYRLGALGWAVFQGAIDETGYAGNYGMMDIVTELQWMQSNIATFGGNPAKLNLYGESAGGAHVMALLASPKTSGLVASFTMQSPYIGTGPAMFSQVSRMATSNVYSMSGNCMNTSLPASAELACMRSLPAAYIGTFASSYWDMAYSVGGDAALPSAWTMVTTAGADVFPVIDGEYLLTDPMAAIMGGNNADKPVIVGHVWFSPSCAFTSMTHTHAHTHPTGASAALPKIAQPALSPTCTDTVSCACSQNADEQATFYNDAYYFPTSMQNPNSGYAPFKINNVTSGGGIDFTCADGSACPGSLTTYFGNEYIIAATSALPNTATITEIWLKAQELSQSATYTSVWNNMYAAEKNLFIRQVKSASDAWLSSVTMIGDARLAYTGGAATYRYLYAQEEAASFSSLQPGFGACHGCELSYVKGWYEMTGEPNNYPLSEYNSPLGGAGPYMSATYTATELQVGTTMKGYWSNFWTTGDPNGAGLDTWSPIDRAAQHVMAFKAEFGTMGCSMNPCTMLSPCVAESAKDYRKAFHYFHNKGTVMTPPTCDAPVGTFSHKFIGSSCPIGECACTAASRRKLLFGAPREVRPDYCAVCP